jgi:hypothetical protein
MHALRYPCLLLLAAILVVGCSEQVAPTAAVEDHDAPALSAGKIGDAPAESGPYVVRVEANVALFYADANAGLSAVLGLDPVDVCNGSFDPDVNHVIIIDVPNDVDRINVLIEAEDVTTSVWPFTTFDCGLFTTTDPLAAGTADLISTDNDFFGSDNANANAFGFQVHGQLSTDANREAVSFSGHSRCVWDGNDPVTFFQCNDKITLN